MNSIFKGKKITQMGLGLLGRGIGDAAFLAAHGAELIVTDLKKEADLGDALAQLAEYPHITYRLGEHNVADFEGRDLILKGAGVPLDSPHIAHARARGVPIDMSASLFARIAPIPIVGVTGTRGKSTVTHLIYSILNLAYTEGLSRSEGSAGRTDWRSQPVLGGNVRGVSNLALLSEVKPLTIGVFELDSWQCQGFAEELSLDAPGVRQGPHSPQVAVFTTFMPDHLNYYHNDLATYLHDKTYIFAFQNESDTLVIGRQALEALTPYKKSMHGHVIVADASDVPKKWRIPLVGEHNRYNVGVAIATARVLGVDDDVIQQAVESFAALPGRLELVREVRGVKIYNDTNATTPDATMTALRALDPTGQKRIVLIMGGTDKGLDPRGLIAELPKHTKTTIFLKGSGTETVTSERGIDTLAEAVAAAWAHCEAGDILLFSPAFSSFGMFTNEYDRGARFNELVQSIESGV